MRLPSLLHFPVESSTARACRVGYSWHPRRFQALRLKAPGSNESVQREESDDSGKKALLYSAAFPGQQTGAKSPTLTDADIQTLLVDNNCPATLAAPQRGRLDHVSQNLTGRISQRAERHATPLLHT